MDSNINFNTLISLPESSLKNCSIKVVFQTTAKKPTNKTWCVGFELADVSLQDPALASL